MAVFGTRRSCNSSPAWPAIATPPSGRRRPGFSLVELMVVIAIIGTLVGLLLPVVQNVREAGRRVACQNNCRQVGLAMHLFLDCRKTLPANGNYAWNGSSMSVQNAWSALARILPFIEEERLFKGIDFSRSYSTQIGVASNRVGTFICPSERNDRGHGTDPTYGNKYWPLNYAVNMGTWKVLTAKAAGMQVGDGAFSPNRGRRASEFSDGMSKTLAMAEVKAFTPRMVGSSTTATFSPAPEPPTDIASLSLAAFSPTTFSHVEWVDGKTDETGFTTVFAPNAMVRYSSGDVDHDVDVVLAREPAPGDTYAAVTSRSYHPGGVTAIMMDGSVRTVDDAIALPVWRALGTAAASDDASAD